MAHDRRVKISCKGGYEPITVTWDTKWCSLL